MAPQVAQDMPIAEAVKELAGPALSGIIYTHKKSIVEDLASGNTNAFAFSIQNPEDVDCLITRVIVDITTAGGSASSVLDVDTVDGATATGDDIIDGLDLNATGVSDNITNGGSNGDKKPVKWDKKGGTNDDLTGKILVANAASLVGKVVIEYVPLS
ncbi:MAG: hypothetical protein IH956_03115 [Chloroflexi bacterium]|nr:hypothetical protein [Chloroflexota bacterium]